MADQKSTPSPSKPTLSTQKDDPTLSNPSASSAISKENTQRDGLPTSESRVDELEQSKQSDELQDSQSSQMSSSVDLENPGSSSISNKEKLRLEKRVTHNSDNKNINMRGDRSQETTHNGQQLLVPEGNDVHFTVKFEGNPDSRSVVEDLDRVSMEDEVKIEKGSHNLKGRGKGAEMDTETEKIRSVPWGKARIEREIRLRLGLKREENLLKMLKSDRRATREMLGNPDYGNVVEVSERGSMEDEEKIEKGSDNLKAKGEGAGLDTATETLRSGLWDKARIESEIRRGLGLVKREDKFLKMLELEKRAMLEMLGLKEERAHVQATILQSLEPEAKLGKMHEPMEGATMSDMLGEKAWSQDDPEKEDLSSLLHEWCDVVFKWYSSGADLIDKKKGALEQFSLMEEEMKALCNKLVQKTIKAE